VDWPPAHNASHSDAGGPKTIIKQSGAAAILSNAPGQRVTTAGGYVDFQLAGGAVDSDEAFPFQMQNDFLGSFLG
jgi:hypothetical protein